MSKYKLKPLSPNKVKTYSLKSRKSKVNTQSFAKVLSGDEPIVSFVDSLPDILAGKDLKTFVGKVKKAKDRKKSIVFALGAHVIKVGLNPIFIDLVKSGWISGLALNGAGIIHDFEIAFAGQTSEDVAAQIKDGRFGMAKETGELLNSD
jgi:deoxyhypusine synthase